MSVGLLIVIQDERFSVDEEDSFWTLRIERMEEEDAGEYECQVTYEDGMDTKVFKLGVVHVKDTSEEIELDIPPNLTMNDDPISHQSQKVNNKLQSLMERSEPKSLKNGKLESRSTFSDTKLVLPVISLVTIAVVIIILGTVRTVFNKNGDLTTHQSRVSVRQSRTSLNKKKIQSTTSLNMCISESNIHR